MVSGSMQIYMNLAMQYYLLLLIFHEYIGLSEIVDTSVIICYEIYLIFL